MKFKTNGIPLIILNEGYIYDTYINVLFHDLLTSNGFRSYYLMHVTPIVN